MRQIGSRLVLTNYCHCLVKDKGDNDSIRNIFYHSNFQKNIKTKTREKKTTKKLTRVLSTLFGAMAASSLCKRASALSLSLSRLCYVCVCVCDTRFERSPLIAEWRCKRGRFGAATFKSILINDIVLNIYFKN